MKNLDQNTVDGFGDEWSRFDQSDLPLGELQLLFNEYFSIFPWRCITKDSLGFDLGCGTGRWAKLVAPEVEKLGVNVDNFPLGAYKNLSFYTMRTDALDRFGTRLEQRFTRKEINNMMSSAGLDNIEFSSSKPFWCAVGYKVDKKDVV